MWTAITALSITVTVSIVVGLVYLSTQIIGFLQPILVPFAVAGVLAYLLDPVVGWLMRRGISRGRSVGLVFLVATLMFAGVLLVLVPVIVKQAADFTRALPVFVEKAKTNVASFTTHWHDRIKADYGIEIMDYLGDGKKPVPTTQSPVTPSPAGGSAGGTAQTQGGTENFELNDILSGAWMQDALPRLMASGWLFLRNGVGGFLGAFGFLLGLVIVPLYLYYFLTESAEIKERWAEYVPLRKSQFRDEVVLAGWAGRRPVWPATRWAASIWTWQRTRTCKPWRARPEARRRIG
jgi:predicted PurR-regulated permease PerM